MCLYKLFRVYSFWGALHTSVSVFQAKLMFIQNKRRNNEKIGINT